LNAESRAAVAFPRGREAPSLEFPQEHAIPAMQQMIAAREISFFIFFQNNTDSF
jgi:hypothetical protein